MFKLNRKLKIVLNEQRKTFKILTTPFPLLRKEGIKVLGAFCPGKGSLFPLLIKNI
jgi:hypothetical protein